jgi:hypothetical protein
MRNPTICAAKGAFFLILALAIVLLPFPAAAAPPPRDIAKTIVFIFLADDKGNPAVRDDGVTPAVNGTGFIVGVPTDDGRSVYEYLVTAKHVLQDKSGHYYKHVFIRINDRQDHAPLQRLEIKSDGTSQNVFSHADSSVDIAVIPASLDEKLFDVRYIPLAAIKSKEEFQKSNLGPGADVFFSGLFVWHYGVKTNIPIFRFGRVAMIPNECIEWKEAERTPQCVELYLLETMSFGGNSGSPVFFSLGIDRELGSIHPGWELQLAGVMRGSFNEPRLGDFVEVPNRVAPAFAQNLGIAAVTPVHLLREILLSEELAKLRRDHSVQPPPEANPPSDATGSTPQKPEAPNP